MLDGALALINIALYLGDIYVASLAGPGKIGKYSVSYWSQVYPNKLTPPGWVFGIVWATIYTLVGITILSLNFAKKQSNFPTLRFSALIGLSSIFNASWMVVWSYGYLFVGMIIILLLLITAQIADISIIKHRSECSNFLYFLWRITFGIYGAWLTLASILNLTCVIQSQGLSAAGEEKWAFYWIIAAGLYDSVFFAYHWMNGASVLLVSGVLLSIAFKYNQNKNGMQACFVFAAIAPVIWTILALKQGIKRAEPIKID